MKLADAAEQSYRALQANWQLARRESPREPHVADEAPVPVMITRLATGESRRAPVVVPRKFL